MRLCSAFLGVAFSLLTVACGGAHDADATSGEDLTALPSASLPSFLAALRWFDWFKTNYPQWYVVSSPNEADPRPWADAFDPRTDPIFAHNAIDISGVAPQEALALLTSGRSDALYANSSAATNCDTHEPVKLTLGLAYCWTTFGTVQHMTIVELVDDPEESVLAWEGGSPGIAVYHRWIIRKAAGGAHVITEEVERGGLPSLGLYSSRMAPSLHAGHEVWLRGMSQRLAPPAP
jgi:hypothetical protein